MKPKLTIAIPTYNRADKLRISLIRAIECSEKYNIEILVSDNASTDNTKDVVMDIQRMYPAVKYFRNKENLGFDGNFLNCFEKANGEYIWLLSDDDVIMPNAIESILEGCNYSPVCMHLNSSGIKKENPFEINLPRFEENGLLKFTNRDDFIERIGIYCTFVSSLVYKNELVKRVKNKEQYFGTNILQSHILLEIMANEGVYIINTKNCIASRGNTTVHYDVFKTWICNYSELLLSTATKCGFNENVMSEVLERGLSTTIYSFVKTYRQTCPDEHNWERKEIWKYIERYPKIVKKYKRVINCSVKHLKWIKIEDKLRKILEDGK